MPIDSSRSIAAGTPAASQPSRSSRSRRNQGRASSGVSGIGGSVISPTTRAARHAAAASNSRGTSSGGAPYLVASPARSTWISSSGARPDSSAAAIELLEQLDAIDRLDHRERRRRLPGLVRLQVAEEMPPDLEGRSMSEIFCRRFLDTVLAEVALAGGVGLADRVDGKGLGNGDEPDGGGVPAGRPGRGVDARADLGQPGSADWQCSR